MIGDRSQVAKAPQHITLPNMASAAVMRHCPRLVINLQYCRLLFDNVAYTPWRTAADPRPLERPRNLSGVLSTELGKSVIAENATGASGYRERHRDPPRLQENDAAFRSAHPIRLGRAGRDVAFGAVRHQRRDRQQHEGVDRAVEAKGLKAQ